MFTGEREREKEREREREGDPNPDQITSYQEKCSSLHNNLFVKVLGMLLPSLNESKNSKMFLGWPRTLDPQMFF